MKKIVSLILVLYLVLSVCACGGGEQNASEAPETTVTTAIPTTEALVPFADLEEEYMVELPVYALEQWHVTLGDRGYTYSDFVLDDQGRILSWKAQESNAKVGFGYSCTYDEAGRLTSMTYDNSLYGYTQTYEYNELGQLISATKTEPDDAEYYLTVTRTYDENGMESGSYTASSSDFYDGGIDANKYEFDELGRISKVSDYSVDMDYLREYTYEYDEAGRVIRSTDSIVDEGVLKEIYENTYAYDFYGFPVKVSVDNTYDYKDDTSKWEETASYAVAGYVEVSSSEDELLNPVSQWIPFEGSDILPTPDSVIAGLTGESAQDGVYRYRVSEGEQKPEYYVYGFMQGANQFGQKDLLAYSVQEKANQALMRYEAVLEQILGLDINEMADKHVVMDGNFGIAVLTLEFVDGAYYLVVNEE